MLTPVRKPTLTRGRYAYHQYTCTGRYARLTDVPIVYLKEGSDPFDNCFWSQFAVLMFAIAVCEVSSIEDKP